MKKYFLALFVLFNADAVANQCEQVFAVAYEIQNQDVKQEVTLWRNKSAVAYENHSSTITDYWTKAPNNRLKLVRLFDGHNRGIEYEAKGYGDKITWQNLYYKFDPSVLKTMELVKSEGQGCDRVEFYTEQHGGETVEVQWLPGYEIAKVIRVKSARDSFRWQLQKLNLDSKAINSKFAQWDEYYLTDYVDIGDNESDPFLAKMINMGFVKGGASGVYDAKGNLLGGHGHRH